MQNQASYFQYKARRGQSSFLTCWMLFQNLFIHDVSPLAPVCLSALALIAPCCQLHSVRFGAYSVWPDWELSSLLIVGLAPTSIRSQKGLSVGFDLPSIYDLYGGSFVENESHALSTQLNLTLNRRFWEAETMNNPYRGHRFPAEIISYCVWLYYTFPLSFRDIEKMMLYRGITVTYEAIRGWGLKFAQGYAQHRFLSTLEKRLFLPSSY